jgi:hypothetical protein
LATGSPKICCCANPLENAVNRPVAPIMLAVKVDNGALIPNAGSAQGVL